MFKTYLNRILFLTITVSFADLISIIDFFQNILNSSVYTCTSHKVQYTSLENKLTPFNGPKISQGFYQVHL